MRTRYKKYVDYGMTDLDVALTRDFLSHLTEDEKRIVESDIARELPEHVGLYVCMALIDGYGYHTLSKMGLIYDKPDFYGYKRKGLAVANKCRKELNDDTD